jgi:heme A synthase
MLGQSLIWIQTNGQFIWPWFKKHPIAVSIITGSVISYIVIYATRMVVEHFDGVLWPGRFIGFASGMMVFALMTWAFMGEGVNAKTGISLLLALALICVQIFVKA